MGRTGKGSGENVAMDTPKQKKPKDLIPKKAQIVLLIVGIPLLVFTGIRFSTQMGWIGGPPKAKKVVQKRQDAPKEPPKSTAAKPGDTGTPKPASVGAPREAPDLDSVSLPDRDPLADLAGPAPGPGARPSPAGPSAGPTPPSTPDSLPPPIPLPAAASTFPSPVTGSAPALPPGMVATQPREPGLPAALAASYPMVRRGGRASRAPSVALVGTISGPQGSLAVVRPADSSGAPGRYVRPGQKVGGQGGAEVEEITPGRLTITGQGRKQELSLPTPGPEPDSATARPEPSATERITPVVDDSTGISPPTE